MSTDKERIYKVLAYILALKTMQSVRLSDDKDVYTTSGVFNESHCPIKGDFVICMTNHHHDWGIAVVESYDAATQKLTARQIGTDKLCTIENELYTIVKQESLGFDKFEGRDRKDCLKLHKVFPESYNRVFMPATEFNGDTITVRFRHRFNKHLYEFNINREDLKMKKADLVDMLESKCQECEGEGNGNKSSRTGS